MTEVASNFTLGNIIKVQTSFGEELSGEVFAYDNGSKTLVLREQGSTPFHHNVRILNCEYIASVTEDTPPATPFSDELPEVDTERCSARYAKALRTAEVDAAKIGVGVTKEAQEIFDGLNKTLPCRWEGKTIIVMEEISLVSPYAPENLRTTHPDDTVAMGRVKKVLIAERERLGY